LGCLLSLDQNQDAFQAYAKLAAPTIQAAGGKYLVRGNPAKVYESGMNQRVVVIEFASVQQALACHEGAGYQESLKVWRRGQARHAIVEASAETTPALAPPLLKRGGEIAIAPLASLDAQRFVCDRYFCL